MSKRIGELLVDSGHLTELELRQALLQQKKQGGKPRLGELLLGLRKITPEVLATAVAEQHKLTFVKLPAEIPQAVSRRLTAEYQKKHNVLPFRKDMVSGVDQIHVAIPDPTQKEVLEQIQGKFREVIRFYVATPTDIAASIERALSGAAAPAPVAANPASASVDPLDDLLGGAAPSAALAGADPMDDLFGGASPSASAGSDLLDDLFGGASTAPAVAARAPSAADPLDDLLGGPAPGPAAPARVSPAADPLDDLLGGAGRAPASSARPPPAVDPLDDLLGGPAPGAAASAPSAADPLDLLGDAAPPPASAARAPSAVDPLDDLFGGSAPRPAAAASSPSAADPLDDLLGGGDAAGSVEAGPHTPLAYIHMFEPKPKPPAAAAPSLEAAPAETAPAPAPLDDSVPQEMLTAGPDDPRADEDAWLIQELQRLAAGEPSQADAVATVASVVRMLVRKGVIQQEALLGELGR